MNIKNSSSGFNSTGEGTTSRGAFSGGGLGNCNPSYSKPTNNIKRYKSINFNIFNLLGLNIQDYNAVCTM